MSDDQDTELLLECRFCDWAIEPGGDLLRDEEGNLYPVSFAFAQLHVLERHPDEARVAVADPEFEAIVMADQLKAAGYEVRRRA